MVTGSRTFDLGIAPQLSSQLYLIKHPPEKKSKTKQNSECSRP